MPEVDFSTEIAAFLKEKPRLLREYGAQWVVFAGSEFKGVFKTLAEAAAFTKATFGSRPVLIRNIEAGEPQFTFLSPENLR